MRWLPLSLFVWACSSAAPVDPSPPEPPSEGRTSTPRPTGRDDDPDWGAADRNEGPEGMCGGIAGFVCAPDAYCDYAGTCGAGDAAGTCRPRPQACSEEKDPVIGCDGRTYANPCAARQRGIDVSTPRR